MKLLLLILLWLLYFSTVRASNLKSKVIHDTIPTYQMEQVVVQSSKKVKYIDAGYLKKPKGAEVLNLPFLANSIQGISVLIKPNPDYIGKYIDKLILSVHRRKSKGKIKIFLYELDSLGNKVSNLLEDLPLQNAHKFPKAFDISHLNIKFPKYGIIMGIQVKNDGNTADTSPNQLVRIKTFNVIGLESYDNIDANFIINHSIEDNLAEATKKKHEDWIIIPRFGMKIRE